MNQYPFLTLVDQILTAKQQQCRDAKSCVSTTNAYTSPLEREIDQMVYELYGLTPEEIAIVEG